MNRQRKFNKTRSRCLGGSETWKWHQDKLPARIAIVPHEVGGMTMVENPTQSLCKHVRGVHNSRKVNQDNGLHWSPMLKCETPNLYMTRAISGLTVIDNLAC